MDPAIHRALTVLTALALPAMLAPACTDRTEPSSEVGRRYAQHLCAVQAACGCDDALLIPSCEARVEREIIEAERKALAAGLELDQECFEQTLEYVDGFPICTAIPNPPTPACPIYTANAEEGEACETYDYVPWMTDCRAGLWCYEGFCRNFSNPPPLFEGEICSDTQARFPTGFLGRCTEGLVCDSDETRLCVPDPLWPPVPTGGVCTSPFACVDESYCRPQDLDGHPSEELPGVCILRTPPGQPCPLPYECTFQCTDGRCEAPQPRLCDILGEWWGRESP